MRIGNWPLLMLALEHIIKHADQYAQYTWRSDCGTFRCLAGWIALFAGWRDVLSPSGYFCGVNRTGHSSDEEPTIPIEDAALTALDLDPEIYGTGVSYDRSDATERLADALFGGFLEFGEILEEVRDLMRTDGVTPTPLIRAEMVSAGLLTETETW